MPKGLGRRTSDCGTPMSRAARPPIGFRLKQRTIWPGGPLSCRGRAGLESKAEHVVVEERPCLTSRRSAVHPRMSNAPVDFGGASLVGSGSSSGEGLRGGLAGKGAEAPRGPWGGRERVWRIAGHSTRTVSLSLGTRSLPARSGSMTLSCRVRPSNACVPTVDTRLRNGRRVEGARTGEGLGASGVPALSEADVQPRWP